MSKRALLSLALLISLCAMMLPAASQQAFAVQGAIFTSQLGFAPDDVKTAVLALPTATTHNIQSVSILTESLGPSDSPAVIVGEKTSGWYGSNAKGDTYVLDFSGSPPPSPGRYIVQAVVDGGTI